MDARLRELLALHFDPRWGAPYWVERARSLDFDPRREIAEVADLARLGPFDLGALAARPIEDLVPRRWHGELHRFVTSETGGTTGAPRRTAFREDEFHAAFVAPFLAAAEHTGFPRGRHWLFVGPSGPHAIGKAARLCATALGSVDPFAVDFDPRWARSLPPGSMARRRYLEHVLAQAEDVLRTQDVGVLFATPPVLEALGTRLEPRLRERIEGLHLGGLAPPPGFRKRLVEEHFPRARALSGYGNSLAGVCPELAPGPGDAPEYFPHGARLRLEVVAPDASGRGRVRFHRLDESCLLPNVDERDEAAPVAPPAGAADAGFVAPGLRDPRPPEDRTELSEGLY